MSDSEHSLVTYTSAPSLVEDYSSNGSPKVDGPPSPDYVPGPEEPDQAPLSPDYVSGLEEPEQEPPLPVYLPYVPKPVYTEYMPPEDDVFLAEEQPLPIAAKPTADSPGYIPEFDPKGDLEEDDEEDPEEDPADYPADYTVVALPAVDHVPTKEVTEPLSRYHLHHYLYHHHHLITLLISRFPKVVYRFGRGCVLLLLPLVRRVDISPGRLMSRELDYDITDTWDELVGASEEIAPTTLQGVNQRVTDLSTVVEQETTIMYGIMEDAQDDRSQLRGRVNLLYMDRHVHRRLAVMIEREARMAREAWGLFMDANDNARSDVMSLRTTLVAHHALILDLHATDHRRQGVIKELLAANHKSQVQLTKALRLLKGLQTQMIEFQRHHRPAKGPA
uniref:Uncharacterized protein n=1 Tax=Tanacetum cinerariifolium TaxID=118510 RepID=A0A699IWE7_TANCI|nr:hypothetical protein [Tanacetum cinerariifolium]